MSSDRTVATAAGEALSQPSGRGLVILAAGVVPWVVVPFDGGFSLVFSVGLVNPASGSFESVLAWLFVDTRGLPRSLLAWPTATALYVLGVASAALWLFDREDRRVTAGLFVLAGLDLLYFAVVFSRYRIGVTALPFGTVALFAAAWVNRP